MDIKEKLYNIFAQNGFNFLSSSCDEELNLDSMQFISIVCDIENEFDLELPDNYLTNNELVSFTDYVELIKTLKEKQNVLL